MRKAWVVARHEFVTTVRRWGFLFVTFGLPLFLGSVVGVALLIQSRSMKREDDKIEQARLGFVDEAAVLTLPPPNDWRRYPSRDEARRRMAADGVEIVAILPPDYLEKGFVDVFTTIRPSIFNVEPGRMTYFLRQEFREWLAQNVLADADPARVRRAREPAYERSSVFLSQEGGVSRAERPEDYYRRMVSGVGFFFLLFMSISVAGGYLIQGMADEKENRVLEMVISSMSPVQLMAGKLAGLGAVGLLQVAVWSLIGVSTAVALAVQFLINTKLFFFCAVFYLLGYLLFGSLLLGVGALGSNQREATQYTSVVTLLSLLPLFVLFPIVAEPQGVLARVLTYIPVTTPVTMMLRYGVDPQGTPAWEVVAAIALLAASTVVSLRLSARLYRAGLLLYGKRASLREIWRWLRS